MPDTESTSWPLNPDDGIPEEWASAITEIAGSTPPSLRDAATQKARALMLLDEMRWQRHIFWAQADRAARESRDAQTRHEQSLSQARASADAADRHAVAMKRATWILAGATVALAVATVGLIWATLAA